MMNVYYFHHQADELLGTASEQFLGKSVKEIKQTVLQTLEGHLRAILGKFQRELRQNPKNSKFLLNFMYNTTKEKFFIKFSLVHCLFSPEVIWDDIRHNGKTLFWMHTIWHCVNKKPKCHFIVFHQEVFILKRIKCSDTFAPYVKHEAYKSNECI